jgi:hypothetical protein
MFGLDPRDRVDFSATFPDCQTPEFVQLMIGLAREARSVDPPQATARLVLALTAADAAGAGGSREMDVARVVASADLAATYYVTGDVGSARRSLEDARRRAEALGDGDLLAKVDQCRILVTALESAAPATRTLIDQALATAGISRHALGKLHLTAGASLDRSQPSVEALNHFETGLRLIDPSRQPDLVGVGLGNLGYELVRLGMPADGRYFLHRALATFHHLKLPLQKARALRLASWADWGEGAHEPAIDKLEISAHRLASLHQPMRTAEVLLDLSRALACRGRWVQAAQAANRARTLLASCDVPWALSIADAVASETGRTRRRSATRVEEAIAPML